MTRIWDLIPADARQWAISQGWSRYPIQEGEAGNGIQFLAMHRVMIRQLIAAFPTHAALFAGWPTPPTNPADPDQPLPGSSTAVITAPMLAAIDTIHNGLAVHPADDGVGRYIETRLRPVPGNPGASSPDPSAGIHNYLHNRWSNDADPVNMGDPAVNIENRIFWRLHG